MEQVVCPFCNGAGCEQCQGSGQLQLSRQEIQQMQAYIQPPVQNDPFVNTNAYSKPSGQKTIPGTRITVSEVKTTTAGFLSLFLILFLAGGAYLSNKYFHTLNPYFGLLGTLGLVFSCLWLNQQYFFTYQEPNDFIMYSKQLDLQKNPQID